MAAPVISTVWYQIYSNVNNGAHIGDIKLYVRQPNPSTTSNCQVKIDFEGVGSTLDTPVSYRINTEWGSDAGDHNRYDGPTLYVSSTMTSTSTGWVTVPGLYCKTTATNFICRVYKSTNVMHLVQLNVYGQVYWTEGSPDPPTPPTPSQSTPPTWAGFFNTNWDQVTSTYPEMNFFFSSSGGNLVASNSYYKITVTCTTSGGGGPWTYWVRQDGTIYQEGSGGNWTNVTSSMTVGNGINYAIKDSFDNTRVGKSYKYVITAYDTVNGTLTSRGACSTQPIITVVASSYTVTVTSENTNMGTVSGGGQYAQGTSLTIYATPKTGFKFSKWTLTGLGTTTTTTASYQFTMPGNAVTAKASFAYKTYTISYNANGGSGAPSSQTKTHGTAITLSTVKPTRKGYWFAGWSKSSSATTPTASYAPGSTYNTDAALTLYAVWYKCAYICTGGTTWVPAIPYICTGGTTWKRAMPYICTGGTTWL